NLTGVAGVLIDSDRDLLFTSDRAAARVSIFRCSDEKLFAQVAVGPRPNGLAFDTRRRHLYSFNLGEPPGTDCTASDVMHDESRHLLYVAIGSPGVVTVFDTERLEEIETVETEEGAHTIGWDPPTAQLYAFAPQRGGALVFQET